MGSVAASIIIVGAGRSGTKMLRSILASHPQTVCFPREINYIWRHGNAAFPTDELRPEHARPEVVRYIRARFARMREGHGGARVIEKTCANALRVDFVHRILPEAHIIHLVRDGRAVAESARRRWQAPPEPRYLLEKARWIPLVDVPYYLLRYLRYQVGRLRAHRTAQASWGPRFSGLDRLVQERSLIEVCGLQWKACVQAADASFNRLPGGQGITVRYEDLVGDPLSVVGDICDRVGLSFVRECRDYVQREVHQRHVDKWRRELSDQDLRRLMPHIEKELIRRGYEI
jgi:hypothetical protein